MVNKSLEFIEAKYLFNLDIDKINGFDTAAIYGRALEGMAIGFDSTTDDNIPNMSFDNYNLIIWVTGEESTYNETFTHLEQQKITSFLFNA